MIYMERNHTFEGLYLDPTVPTTQLFMLKLMYREAHEVCNGFEICIHRMRTFASEG